MRTASQGLRDKRKPILLFRFSELLLLRLAERQFSGLLFHEPPRNTRVTRTHYCPRRRLLVRYDGQTEVNQAILLIVSLFQSVARQHTHTA